MKRTNFILAFLFNACLGILLMGIAFGLPILGLAFGLLAYLPMPKNVLGENVIPTVPDTEKEEAFLLKIQEKARKAFDDYSKDFISAKALELKLEPLLKQLEEMKANTELNQVKSAIDEISKRISLMDETKNVFESKEDAIRKAAKEFTESEKYQEWVKGGFKGEAPKIELKYTLTSSRTGTVLVSVQSPVVQDAFTQRKIHVRDLMAVGQIDEPYLVHDKVVGYSYPLTMLAENDAAVAVDLTTTEITTTVVRVAAYWDVSKRAMKAVKWLQNKIVQVMPEFLKLREDFEVLFGDGGTNNVNGVVKNATVLDVTGPSFVAGAVASVATYNSGASAIVTFVAAHGLNNGQIITFANATAARYNAAFPVNVVSSTKILITPAGGYTAEADTSAWTGTSKWGNSLAINLASEIDVLNAAKAIMGSQEYIINAHLVNPITISIIEGLKDTTGQYLAGIQYINGVYYVGGVPVIPCSFIQVGFGLSADFQNLGELLEFTGITLTATTDATYAKANKVCIIAEEELVVPIYNPFMATYYNFATVKTALETA